MGPTITEILSAFVFGAVHLGMGTAALVWGRRTPLTFGFVALSLTTGLYQGLQYVSDLTGDPWSDRLEVATAAWITPLALFFLVTFTGERRRSRRLLGGAGVYFGLLGAAALVAPSLDMPRAAAPLGLGLIGFSALTLERIVRRWWRARGEAQLQLQLVLAALLLGGGAALSSLLRQVGAPTPHLVPFGLVISQALLGIVACRVGIVATTGLLALNAAALAGAFIVLEGVGVVLMGDRLGLGLLVATVGLLFAALLGRELWRTWRVQRQNERHLLTLGRLGAQLIHDLRGPLTAAQLHAELAGHEDDDLSRQLGRMKTMLSEYQRVGRCEAEPRELELAELLEPLAVETRVQLDLAVGRARLDPLLVKIALENLIRNARQASRDEQGVVMRARARGPRLHLEVIDRGEGMTPWIAERALEDFGTTRAEGTGLGLPFALRVARAHGGQLEIDSSVGEGTTVRLDLPLDATDALPSSAPSSP